MTVVQRTPNLGLGIRLTPLAPEPEPAAPAPCPPARVLDPTGAVVAELGCGEEYQYECPVCPPGGGGCDVSGVVWAGRYWIHNFDWGPDLHAPVAFPDFSLPSEQWTAQLLEFGVPGPLTPSGEVFYGVPEGADVSGVTWEWSWSDPVLHNEQIVQMGPLLRVELLASDIADGGQDYSNVLTATAKCRASAVGTLVLKVGAGI